MGDTLSESAVTHEAIRDHLETVLASSVFNGSAKHSALLRYLVTRTLADEPTHEIDLAVDVFGKDQTYDPAESSSVRVCVHQLRKKLREHYATCGQSSDIRLSIPKGSYRVSFGTPLAAGLAGHVAHNSAPRALISRRRWIAAVSVLLVVSLGANVALLLQRSTPSSRAPTTPSAPGTAFAWQDLSEGPEPILIALGDVFFFTETAEDSGYTRYIRDIAINSIEDFRRLGAERYGSSLLPSDMTYLPNSTAFALEAILPLARATGKPVSLKLMSDVTAEDLRENDVVYIGFFRNMGALRDYFFEMSSFAIDSPYLELYRKDASERFVWSGHLFGRTRDYGLFSKLPGPGRGEILVFAGISPPGMLHAVRALTDPSTARAVERNVRERLNDVPRALEVLFEAKGYDRVDLEATMISAGPLLVNEH
jgi:hypothetical protein